MTSKKAADRIARELRFGSGGRELPLPATGTRFGFVVDVDSTQSWPDLPYDTAAPASRCEPPAQGAVLAILDQAAAVLAVRAPRAHAFIDAQLDRVLVRRSGQIDAASSASHRARLGMCVLTNLDSQHDALQIATEALLHESIHQFLYRLERLEGNFCDLTDAPTFRSPWSGARLPLHSLVHASFVWFGLLTLWSELALIPASDAEAAHAHARIAHCLFGYAFLDDLLRDASFPRERVAPAVLACLESVSAAACGAARLAESPGTLQSSVELRRAAAWPAALAAALAADG
jgi:HEXXH motif-containing protein